MVATWLVAAAAVDERRYEEEISLVVGRSTDPRKIKQDRRPMAEARLGQLPNANDHQMVSTKRDQREKRITLTPR